MNLCTVLDTKKTLLLVSGWSASLWSLGIDRQIVRKCGEEKGIGGKRSHGSPYKDITSIGSDPHSRPSVNFSIFTLYP